jgi:hypothetical protein
MAVAAFIDLQYTPSPKRDDEIEFEAYLGNDHVFGRFQDDIEVASCIPPMNFAPARTDPDDAPLPTRSVPPSLRPCKARIWPLAQTAYQFSIAAPIPLVGWPWSLGLRKYAAAFRENLIDETVLPTFDSERSTALGVDVEGR